MNNYNKLKKITKNLLLDMHNSKRLNTKSNLNVILNYILHGRSYILPSDTSGSGAGKGGGRSVKETGGELGKLGAVQEDGYFYNKDREKIEKMKQKLKDELQKPDKSRRPDQ